MNDTSFNSLLTEPKSYVCYRTAEPILCDGNLYESSWKLVNWTEYFLDIEGSSGTKPYFNTRTKMLWDDNYLYVAAEIEEQDVFSYVRKRDDIVYHDNDFEVFLDPDGDGRNYFEIEVNAINNILDLFMAKPYRDMGGALITWDAKDLVTGVHIDGTLNDGKDKDRGWTVEMAIPFKSLQIFPGEAIPKAGDYWRINFSRVEWDMEFKEGEYRKIIDPLSGKSRPEHNWVWSPHGIVNMHYPERWGYVFFSEHFSGTSAVIIEVPEEERMKRVLWQVYYREHAYFNKHRTYTSKFADLGINKTVYMFNDSHGELSLENISTAFEATLVCKDLSQAWSLNQDGEIRKILDYEKKGIH